MNDKTYQIQNFLQFYIKIVMHFTYNQKLPFVQFYYTRKS